MLKDFTKIETFLTTVRERSFSRASAKIGISQPAVTQQIKYLEKHLGVPIVERKKNGIRLTAEGEEFYKIVARLEKHLNEAELDILKIVDKKTIFKLGASFTIGTYVVPGECLHTLGIAINNDITLDIALSQEIVSKIKDRKLDVGLIESQILDNDLVYREWLEDELVIVSNVPIPKTLRTEDLYEFSWICREEGSHTRRTMAEVFGKLGVSCRDFKVLNEVSNTTAVLQSIKRSKKDSQNPIVSVISKYAIADEVASGVLFESRIVGYEMNRKFYIVYSKENKHNTYIDKMVSFILDGRC